MKSLFFPKFASFLLTLLFAFANLNASGLFTELSLEDKTIASQYIIEGQLLSQESFWDQSNNQILTAYEVLVYKSFKDEIQSDHLYIIADGGTIGDEMHRVFPEFNTQIGDVGVFFLKDNPAEKSWNKEDKTLQFRLISNNQAAIKYDLKRSVAVDNFRQYFDIEKELHETISQKVAKEYVVWNDAVWNNKDQKSNQNNYKSGALSIDCVYPNVIVAGNDITLTITGDGFGELGLKSQISLADPNTGGQTKKVISSENIVYWDNNTIEVIIPDNVGTGTIMVETQDQGAVESTEELFVKYAVNTSGSDETPSMLVNQNGQGGYSFNYSTSTSNGGVNFATSAATAPFERALDRLQEEVGFNAVIAGGINMNTVSNDGYNLVMFDNNNDILTAAGLLHAQYSRCGGMWEVVGMDIIFRRSGTGSPVLNWNYTTDNPAWNELDFESVAIHELVHGLQIKHNMQQASLMYFAYSFGSQKRLLNDCYDKSAIKVVNDRSLEYTPKCYDATTYELHNAFQGYNINNAACIAATECGISPIDALNGSRIKVKVMLEGFLANSGMMSNMLAYNGVLPFAQPFNAAPWNYEGTETMVNSFPTNTTDWVFVTLHDSADPTKSIAEKAALVDINGNIFDVESNEGVAFQNVPPGDYYVSIRHCSHLGVISNEPISIPNSTPYDFTDTVDKAMGFEQQSLRYGKYAMVSGDYDGNGIINNLDFNKWNQQNALVDEYVTWDGDGNGVVNNLDFNLWSTNRSKIGISYLQK